MPDEGSRSGSLAAPAEEHAAVIGPFDEAENR